jgi:hypothetical protein
VAPQQLAAEALGFGLAVGEQQPSTRVTRSERSDRCLISVRGTRCRGVVAEETLKAEPSTADTQQVVAMTGIQAERNQRLKELATWLPSLAIFTLFGVVGRWVFWVADDICRAVQRRNLGFLDMQLHEYRTWAGRYTSSALIGFAVKFGDTSAHIAPAVLAGLCLALCTAAALRIPASIVPKRYAPIVGALGCLSLFALFENFGQSVLWLTGGLTYFAPYLLIGAALLCAFPQTANPLVATAARLAAPTLTFLAVGCSEVVGATIVGGLIVACLFGSGRLSMLAGPISASLRVPPVSPFPTGKPDRGLPTLAGPISASLRVPPVSPFPTGKPDRGLRKQLWPCTLASLIGFAVMAASPGNAIRRSINPHLPLRELPLSAVGETFRLFVWLISHRTLLVGVAIFVGTLLNPDSSRLVPSPDSGRILKSRKLGLHRGVELAGLSMFVGVPYGAVLLGYVSAGQGLTPRARISAIVPMMLGIVLLSWFANSRWTRRKTQSDGKQKTVPKRMERRVTRSTVFLLCALSIAAGAFQAIVPAAVATRNLSGVARDSAQKLTRNSGTTNPIGLVGPGTIWGLANFSGDGDWVLQCVESYYNVRGAYSMLEPSE